MNALHPLIEQFLYHRIENFENNGSSKLEKGLITEAEFSSFRVWLREQTRRIPIESEFLSMLPEAVVGQALAAMVMSKSQVRQDIFVLSELGFKSSGFFVEFGATDGLNLSNTWLLENFYNWKGVLAEPARCWHEKLVQTRSCIIDSRCVWNQTGASVLFREAPIGDLSTIIGYGEDDQHAAGRSQGSSYEVQTVTLNDLLDSYNAPSDPDYLSIDTEGSEFDILSSFNFERYSFKVITCEHNFTPQREKIYQLLTSAGYVRKFEKFSEFDDWYVKA